MSMRELAAISPVAYPMSLGETLKLTRARNARSGGGYPTTTLPRMNVWIMQRYPNPSPGELAPNWSR